MYQRLRLLLTALSAQPTTRMQRLTPWLITGMQLLVLLAVNGALIVGAVVFWPLFAYAGSADSASAGILGLVPIYLQLLLASAGLSSVASRSRSRETDDTALALRRAAQARDAVAAPAAQGALPTPLADGGFTNAPSGATLSVAMPELLRVSRASIGMAFGAGACVALIAIGMAVAIPFATPDFPASVFTDPIALFLLALVSIFGAFSLLLLIAGWRWLRRRKAQATGIAISIGGDGLTSRRAQAPRQQFLAWSGARTLARIVYNDARLLPHTIYLLDAESETLLWEEPPGERYAPIAQQQAAAEWQASAQRLATLIAAHTRLPLLDLSDAVRALAEKSMTNTALALMNDAYFAAINEQDFAAAQALWRMMEPSKQAFLTKLGWSPSARMKPGAQARMAQRTARLNRLNPTSAHTRRAWLRLAQALIPYYPASGANDHATPERQRSLRLERRRQTLNRFLLWSQVAMIALLIIAGLGLKLSGAYTERVAHDLSQQMQRETPLYATSFRYPEGDWPLHTPTKTDTSSRGYVDGAYQITDSNRAYSVPSHTSAINMRDGAEQVTVTELGHADENNLAWVGLLLDANADDSTFTTFMIDELGDWSLSHYNGSLPAAQQWSTPDAGQSDAVRQGAGASNTLLLIRRGNLYLLYVNGVSVDTFSDHDHALTPGGFVGVYLDEGGYIARFNDFAIYPAPANLPFWMR